jgi:hypothetical protein
MTGLKTLYEDDFAAWAQQQAEALHAVVLRRARYPEDQVVGDWFPEDPPR